MVRFLLISFVLILSFSCKEEKKPIACDRINCTQCPEIKLREFTGYLPAECQTNSTYEIVETLNNNNSLCGEKGHFFRFRSDDYKSTKVICGGTDTDYYQFVRRD